MSDLLELLQEKHGKDFHPAILLADVISNEYHPIELRVGCAKTLLPYIEATKKAIEIRGKIDHNVGLLRIGVIGGDVPEVVNPQSIIDIESDDEYLEALND